jgi:signal transduction histidine kinase
MISMKASHPSSYPLTFVIVSFAIWIAVCLRWVNVIIEHSSPNLWLISAMLAIYGIVLGLFPFMMKGSPFKAHLYFGVQSALGIGAILLSYEQDFFSMLFLPLAGQVMFVFPRRTAFGWVIFFGIATVVGLFIKFGALEGLSKCFPYLAGLFLIASFSNLMLREKEARVQSDRLLDELQQAHRQLQEYAGQSEELATAKERNRLARELHDSVAQTLYGLTLQAEAASRKLSMGQNAEVANYLHEIRDSSHQTLKETRLLIFELRPPILEKEGLVPALRARLESVESRSGLKTQINLQEVGKLRNGIESGLYGIFNEVLNNVLKHAHATEVSISLEKQDNKIILEISDNGVGFDPASVETHGGLGLKGMKERAEQFGGDLQIQSNEKGTQVRVEVSDG